MTATLLPTLRVFVAPGDDATESLAIVFAVGVIQLIGHYQAPVPARSWAP